MIKLGRHGSGKLRLRNLRNKKENKAKAVEKTVQIFQIKNKYCKEKLLMKTIVFYWTANKKTGVCLK